MLKNKTAGNASLRPRQALLKYHDSVLSFNASRNLARQHGHGAALRAHIG